MTKALTFLKNKILWFFVGGVALASGITMLEPNEPDSLAGAFLDRELKANEIRNIQNKYESLKVTHGEYTQVTLDGRILVRDGEVVDQQLLDLLPANMIVDVYSGPNGDGFELIQTLSDRIVHYGFGPEAESRTYVLPISKGTASST